MYHTGYWENILFNMKRTVTLLDQKRLTMLMISCCDLTCLPINMFILRNFLLGRGPEEQKGNFLPSVHLPVHPSVRMSKQMSIPSLLAPAPLPKTPGPRPLDNFPMSQPPCFRPPPTPSMPGLLLESPCPPQTDENLPLCSIGHRPL